MSQQPPDPGEESPGQGQPPGWVPPPPPPISPMPYQSSPYVSASDSGSKLASSLGGFFTGVAWLFVVPAITVGIGSSLWPDFAGPGLTFTALVTLGGPIALLFHPRTRRFGAFMLIGMAVTLIVLAGVCVAFIALLTQSEMG
ncbi:hypothetical protein [Nocardioides sp.]|uniref:hypothetical protein n=1 Tax=Nocardioides sp. TaxID=35761 RepID=UPI003D150D62